MMEEEIMTETSLNIKTQPKRKTDILIVLAYILFIYIAVCDLRFIIIRSGNLIDNIINRTTFSLLTQFTMFIMSFIYYCVTAIMFFRIAILNKSIKKWFEYFLYVFLVFNAIIICSYIDKIHIDTFWGVLPSIEDAFFNFLAGASIMNMLFSLAFLKYGSKKNKLAKLVSNKWLVLSIILIMLILTLYNTFDSLISYLEWVSFYRMSGIMSEAFKTILNALKPQFPVLQFIIILFYLATIIIFLVSLIKKKRINKLALAVIIIFVLLLAASIIIDEIRKLDEDDSIIYVFLYPEYISIAQVFIVLGMYRICNKESIPEEKRLE